ncbi:MAG: TrkA C-terminal domain-containing protein, partial [Bradymonadaceae bacterium]
ALTGRVGMNLAVCMEAKQMADQIRTVARVDAAPDEYRRFVDEVVIPASAGARMVANAVIAPQVQSLVELSAGIEILEVEVAADAPAAGSRLEEVDWPEGALVVARSDAESVAHGDTRLEAGVRYVVAVEPAATEKTLHLLRG